MENFPYDFQAYLKNKQTVTHKSRKGDITRKRLELATITALSNCGYRDMKVSDICTLASVSSGAFYQYFENKANVTLIVLEKFIEYLDQMYRKGKAQKTAFKTIYSANIEWLKCLRANPGLYRCILQVGDEFATFSHRVNQINSEWYARISKSVINNFPSTEKSLDSVIPLAVYSLGAMMDEIGRKLVVYPDPNLAELIGTSTPTDEALAEFLSLIWYRTLYGNEPEDFLHTSIATLLSGLHLPGTTEI